MKRRAFHNVLSWKGGVRYQKSSKKFKIEVALSGINVFIKCMFVQGAQYVKFAQKLAANLCEFNSNFQIFVLIFFGSSALLAQKIYVSETLKVSET